MYELICINVLYIYIYKLPCFYIWHLYILLFSSFFVVRGLRCRSLDSVSRESYHKSAPELIQSASRALFQ